ncbi:MAG TPA: zinc ribbon domain-containing protein [Dissulfuribacter thermophilus]|uniref:Zinc ribbon domain-containing protein n=1 Tax=Dissulfuribacter thermophilus TaxID=1156395 RepID=A0A7V2WSU0_9BACT|nr:zinc ribbon domain-containing protein [Dissulfuribacter thermophilus]
MPIYEYECEACGKVVEKWQKISEAPLTTCEECGGRLHKLISMSSFHLKGSGWYVTDYARKSSSSNASSSSSGSTAKENKSSSSKDSSSSST